MDDEYALFAAVVEHGRLSAAARALRLSPAMASRRLARLEDRLGARLLNRTTRRQSPTEAGAVAVGYALLPGVFYRTLTLQAVAEGLLAAAKTSAVVFILFATAELIPCLAVPNQVPQPLR